MTTDVFSSPTTYDMDIGRTGGATNATVYANLTEFTSTRVTNVQSKNATGSTTNPAATFDSTPTNGNALIAVLCRTADNVASTNSSWTLLTSSGVGGSRRLEIWWRRAGASEATTHTWTNATAAAWELTLIECGGWAAKADPVTITTAATTTSAATFGSAMNTNQTSIAGIVLANTISNMSFAAGTSGQLKTATLVSSSTRTGVGFAGAWLNRTAAVPTFSWTTSRAGTFGQVGWPQASFAGGSPGNGANTTTTSAQRYLTWDTSSIPDGNTITDVTLSVLAGTIKATNANLAWYSTTLAYSGVSDSDTMLWQTPTQLGALTKVASYLTSSPWTLLTTYNMTNTGSMIAAINKAGNTAMFMVTDDQVSGTTRATTEQWNVGNQTLTVVHNLQASTTLPNVTTTMTPTISRQVAFSRTLTTVTAGLTPLISRTVAYARTLAASLDAVPTVARLIAYTRTLASSIDTTPIVNRVVALNVTITSTINAIAGLFAARLVPQLPRIVRLGARSTIQLTQIVIARLAGRSTIRLPKE